MQVIRGVEFNCVASMQGAHHVLHRHVKY